ncbi:MAG: 5-(carboxyamino)imidazole ribonucleotide synthase [Nitritalea sp.]
MKKTAISKTLGILGGGQLGRMFIQSAISYNATIHILDPDAAAPCRPLAHQFTQGDLLDEETVFQFGMQCDLITIEIEKVNTAALKRLQEAGKEVYPEPEVIQLIQDKRLQKAFYEEHGIPTAPFRLTADRADAQQHMDFLPAVHKLGRDGYDGRGVSIIRTAADWDKAFDAPGLLEKLVPFTLELAVIVAKNTAGEVKSYPAVACAFHPTANLVEYLYAPAPISAEVEARAQALARQVIDALGMTGILAVEMFLLEDGSLLVNEVAPRPHNSGHHTIEGNFTSQFEQHFRAIMGLPLGETALRCPAAMVNLLGAPGFEGQAIVAGMEEVMAVPGVYVHLYGKKITKPFRKMGHMTILADDVEALKPKADEIRAKIQIQA